jgi:ferrous iron transport protein A
MLMPLDMIGPGEWAEVEEVSGQAAWVGRLAELGIRQGCRLQVVQPGASCLLNVGGCKLCLRSGDCSQILVRPVEGTGVTG